MAATTVRLPEGLVKAREERHMYSYRIVRLIGVALLLAAAMSPAMVLAQGKAAPTVSPAWGVPGTRFTFSATGFRGATPVKDANDNKGEQLSYWVNTPAGVIATEPRSGKTDYGNSEKPLIGQANGYGEVTILWTAPQGALPGAYSMVIHGLKSGAEVSIPFEMRPDGVQTVVQAGVTPRIGPAGGEFRFVATGFDGAGYDAGRGGKQGERVSYWFNTPDGSVIATEPRSGETDYGNDEKPLLHYADDEGVVNLVWSAPTDLKPGVYSVVFHGLSSQHQVLMFFTIQ